MIASFVEFSGFGVEEMGFGELFPSFGVAVGGGDGQLISKLTVGTLLLFWGMVGGGGCCSAGWGLFCVVCWVSDGWRALASAVRFLC